MLKLKKLVVRALSVYSILKGGLKVTYHSYFSIFCDNLFWISLIKLIADFLNLIYFRICEGRQKPDKHYVTKSIADSPST